MKTLQECINYRVRMLAAMKGLIPQEHEAYLAERGTLHHLKVLAASQAGCINTDSRELEGQDHDGF